MTADRGTGALQNVPQSVHQRLKNLARERGIEFNLVLQRFCAERFLYRLGLSTEVDRFTLKGAALFLVWTGETLRTTRDVDLLGSGPSDHAAMRQAMAAICTVVCAEDGLTFDGESIRVADIREAQELGGVRVKLRARLGAASIPLQVDVGFGDAITPERLEAQYPTMLDHPAPRLWTYPRETMVAEKFEAMVRLGRLNTRMKDFWDVAALAARFAFDGETLRSAIEETFLRRGTVLTNEVPDALRAAFYAEPERLRQWEAFQRKAAAHDGPRRLDEAGELVRTFLDPIRESLVRNEPFTRRWPSGGAWLVGAGLADFDIPASQGGSGDAAP